MLHDDLVQCWADPWAIGDSHGALFAQADRVIAPLISKADSGLRPTAAVAALYRVAMSARTSAVAGWTRALERPHFTAAAGSSATDQVWQQVARAESGSRNTHAHVGLLVVVAGPILKSAC